MAGLYLSDGFILTELIEHLRRVGLDIFTPVHLPITRTVLAFYRVFEKMPLIKNGI